VLDLDHSLVNQQMVELRPVPEDAAKLVHDLVLKHHQETGSTVAEQLLENWEQSIERFTEIMPVNYRIILEAREKAKAEGLNEEDTTARMMEVASG
jgi:glutamate synthase (NADPH) large chain